MQYVLRVRRPHWYNDLTAVPPPMIAAFSISWRLVGRRHDDAVRLHLSIVCHSSLSFSPSLFTFTLTIQFHLLDPASVHDRRTSWGTENFSTLESTLEDSMMPPFPFPGRPPTLSLLDNSESRMFWVLALFLLRNLPIFLDSTLLPSIILIPFPSPQIYFDNWGMPILAQNLGFGINESSFTPIAFAKAIVGHECQPPVLLSSYHYLLAQ